MSRADAYTCDKCGATWQVKSSTHAVRVHLPTGKIEHDGGPGNDRYPVCSVFDLCGECARTEYNRLTTALAWQLGEAAYRDILRRAGTYRPARCEEQLG